MTTQPYEGRGAIPEWTFGDRLRKVRRDRGGLTQEQFAERIGVGGKAYGAWEAGKNEPGGSDMVAVAKRIELAFGVPAGWMLGLDDSPFRPDGGDSAVETPSDEHEALSARERARLARQGNTRHYLDLVA